MKKQSNKVCILIDKKVLCDNNISKNKSRQRAEEMLCSQQPIQ